MKQRHSISKDLMVKLYFQKKYEKVSILETFSIDFNIPKRYKIHSCISRSIFNLSFIFITVGMISLILISSAQTAKSQIVFGPEVVNPFGISPVGDDLDPTCVDLDNDGDLDLMIGSADGNFRYFENSGTFDLPDFPFVATNPFGLANIGVQSAPSFVDLDNDGDKDLFSGEFSGSFFYFHNIGTPETPYFADVDINPFGLTDETSSSNPCFADMDIDGDYDLIVGSGLSPEYFENSGTPDSAYFPFAIAFPFGLGGGDYFSLTFADLDYDYDLDLLKCSSAGQLKYFENIGDEELPVFDYGLSDPFGIIGWHKSIEFVDFDGDGDMDLIAGYESSDIFYFENITCIPITYYVDIDEDEYGNSNSDSTACLSPFGYVVDSSDCNDLNSEIYPGATEILNGLDDNCNNEIDEGLVSINSTENNFYINTYPNPASGQFTIELNTTQLNDQQIILSIINILGEEIFNKTSEIKNGKLIEQINLYQTSGIYILKLLGREGQYEKQIIIE